MEFRKYAPKVASYRFENIRSGISWRAELFGELQSTLPNDNFLILLLCYNYIKMSPLGKILLKGSWDYNVLFCKFLGL